MAPSSYLLIITGEAGRSRESAAKPDLNELISLRMDCHACEYVIATRCYGVPEIKTATRIGHFLPNEWGRYVTLEEVLNGAA